MSWTRARRPPATAASRPARRRRTATPRQVLVGPWALAVSALLMPAVHAEPYFLGEEPVGLEADVVFGVEVPAEWPAEAQLRVLVGYQGEDHYGCFTVTRAGVQFALVRAGDRSEVGERGELPAASGGDQAAPGERGTRYRLQLTTDKAGVFKCLPALQALSDRYDAMSVRVLVDAEAAEGLDPVWLRNAVEELLDEANVERRSRLER